MPITLERLIERHARYRGDRLAVVFAEQRLSWTEFNAQVNQLANALRPIVLPGEEMNVALIKEGKDPNQAIGYLDDGTMVVVENGRKKMSQEVDVTVTSVLQTTAGRMIFTRLK